MTLVEMVRKKADKYEAKPAIISGERRVSYRELEESSNKVASVLAELGVRKGDRVVVLLPNSPDFVTIFLGMVKAGAIAVLLDPRYQGEDLASFLQETEPLVLVGEGPTLEALVPLLPRFRSIKHLIALTPGPPETAVSYQELMRRYPAQSPQLPLSLDDITNIFYTSGTTGRPKGVMRSHRTLLAGISSMARSLGQGEADIAINLFPSSHAAGVENITLATFFAGGTVVIPREMSPHHLLPTIEKEKITMVCMVPTLLTAIASMTWEEIGKYHLSSVRLCFGGGSVISNETRKKVKALFGCDLLSAWGSTEAGSAMAVQPLDGSGKEGSAGRAASGWVLKVMDDSGRELPAESVGELVVKGPSVMVGYYKNPHATQGTLRDGWLHTGDVGKIDGDGNVFILGRKKDVIALKSKEVYPGDIEDVLYAHHGVAEAAVLGVPGGGGEPVIKAVIVPRPGMEVTPEEIKRFCEERLAPHEVPAIIQLRDSMPRTAIGKIRREDLRT